MWEAPSEVFGTLSGYRVSFGPKGGRADDWRTEELRGDVKTTFRAAGLTKGRLYEFQVAAANEIGFGEIAKKTMSTPEGEGHKFETGGAWNLIL